MSRRVIEVLTDDLDGTDADDTIRFAIDGIEYEIDLSLPNANKMRGMFETYVGAARRVGKMAGGGRQIIRAPRRDAWLDRAATRPPASGATYDPAAKQHRAEVREWAREHGLHVPDRGRIMQSIMDAFDAKDPTKLPNYNGPLRGGSSTRANPVPAAAFQPGVTQED